jgi:SAM-dependent methyltransferase
LSPIQPDSVPPNCSFRVDDIEKEWIDNEMFDFIHTRAMVGGVKDWSLFFRRAYEHLRPGGYIELQDPSFPAHCEDPKLASESLFMRWSQHIVEGIGKVGVNPRVVENWAELLHAAGFVDIHVKWHNWPIGPWPKGEKNKMLGRWAAADFYNAVPTTVAVFTRALKWLPEEYDVFVAKIRNEIKVGKMPVYLPICFCYARKPPADNHLQDQEEIPQMMDVEPTSTPQPHQSQQPPAMADVTEGTLQSSQLQLQPQEAAQVTSEAPTLSTLYEPSNEAAPIPPELSVLHEPSNETASIAPEHSVIPEAPAEAPSKASELSVLPEVAAEASPMELEPQMLPEAAAEVPSTQTEPSTTKVEATAAPPSIQLEPSTQVEASTELPPRPPERPVQPEESANPPSVVTKDQNTDHIS